MHGLIRHNVPSEYAARPFLFLSFQAPQHLLRIPTSQKPISPTVDWLLNSSIHLLTKNPRQMPCCICRRSHHPISDRVHFARRRLRVHFQDSKVALETHSSSRWNNSFEVHTEGCIGHHFNEAFERPAWKRWSCRRGVRTQRGWRRLESFTLTCGYSRVGDSSVIRVRGAPGVELLSKMTAEKPVAEELLWRAGASSERERAHRKEELTASGRYWMWIV